MRERIEDVVVVVPDDFAKKFRSSTPAPVQIVSDGSRNDSRPKVQRVRDAAAALQRARSARCGWSAAASARRSPPPLQIEDVEVSSAQQRAAPILCFIPMFIVLAAFTGGMQIATDSTAGERERGSLEPLLVNPAPRGAIAAGKWLAATLRRDAQRAADDGAGPGDAALHPAAGARHPLPDRRRAGRRRCWRRCCRCA